MSRVTRTEDAWHPQTRFDREAILLELQSILASPHFSNSKRYPALLQYVVEKTLDGESDSLKERTLGVEVFDRPPAYDTNADTIVRYTAGEVRKRLSLYYHDLPKRAAIQILLPAGSYAPAPSTSAADSPTFTNGLSSESHHSPASASRAIAPDPDRPHRAPQLLRHLRQPRRRETPPPPSPPAAPPAAAYSSPPDPSAPAPRRPVFSNGLLTPASTSSTTSSAQSPCRSPPPNPAAAATASTPATHGIHRCVSTSSRRPLPQRLCLHTHRARLAGHAHPLSEVQPAAQLLHRLLPLQNLAPPPPAPAATSAASPRPCASSHGTAARTPHPAPQCPDPPHTDSPPASPAPHPTTLPGTSRTSIPTHRSSIARRPQPIHLRRTPSHCPAAATPSPSTPPPPQTAPSGRTTNQRGPCFRNTPNHAATRNPTTVASRRYPSQRCIAFNFDARSSCASSRRRYSSSGPVSTDLQHPHLRSSVHYGRAGATYPPPLVIRAAMPCTWPGGAWPFSHVPRRSKPSVCDPAVQQIPAVPSPAATGSLAQE